MQMELYFCGSFHLLIRSGEMFCNYLKNIRKVLLASLFSWFLLQKLYLCPPLQMEQRIYDECYISLLDTNIIGKRPMVALSLIELPHNSNHIALAMGGLDNKIHIYSGERTGKVCN